MHKSAASGSTGVSRETVSAGLRLIVFGNYCIYFRTTDTDLVVARVLNGAQDIDPLDFGDDITKQ